MRRNRCARLGAILGSRVEFAVRAIQCLGGPSFQEKNTQFADLLKNAKERLVEAGCLRSIVEVQ
jgi:hypothetical protein